MHPTTSFKETVAHLLAERKLLRQLSSDPKVSRMRPPSVHTSAVSSSSAASCVRRHFLRVAP
jgi:hypothetical protein